MKVFILSFVFSILTFSVLAQATVEKKRRVEGGYTEVYHVLEQDPGVMHGLYQMRFGKKMALASGNYDHHKRVGIWHFFDLAGALTQNYNYDTKEITYEAPESIKSNLRYVVDKVIRDTDMVSRPVKPGGRIFGYLVYLRTFKKPKSFSNIDPSQINVTLELLVSPGGRLADFKLKLASPYRNESFNVNLDQLAEEDKQFVPATYNGEPVSCTIMVSCRMDYSNHLYFPKPFISGQEGD